MNYQPSAVEGALEGISDWNRSRMILLTASTEVGTTICQKTIANGKHAGDTIWEQAISKKHAARRAAEEKIVPKPTVSDFRYVF